jgi:hypothetical protein
MNFFFLKSTDWPLKMINASQFDNRRLGGASHSGISEASEPASL